VDWVAVAKGEVIVVMAVVVEAHLAATAGAGVATVEEVKMAVGTWAAATAATAVWMAGVAAAGRG
jgi:hypothetical protein